MHFIKRAAFRAVAAQSAIARSAVPSSTPFAIRNQAAVVSAFKRFNSTENKPEQEQTIVEQAKETVSDIASQAKEAVQERVESFNNNTDRNTYRQPLDRAARPPREVTPNPTIYVGNIVFEATTAELENAFRQFGEIKSVRLAQDSRGLSKGFGYVEFATTEQAAAAIESMHDQTFEGRRMVVNFMTAPKRVTRQMQPPSKTLFIGNLAFEMTDADLNKLFRDIKNVIDVRVAIDRRTGQPRGFAHADFTDVESAVAAAEQLQGKSCYDRQLRVDYSSGSKQVRPRRDQGEEGRDSF